MYLYVLLACALWGLESHSAPMKITNEPHYDNHTAVCAEIQRELLADNMIYNVSLSLHQTSLGSQWLFVFLTNFSCFQGSFKRPQNTSEVRSSHHMDLSHHISKGSPQSVPGAEIRTKDTGEKNLGRKLRV